eukprot:scaffold16717_cov53-Attheya_sp.AAC.8
MVVKITWLHHDSQEIRCRDLAAFRTFEGTKAEDDDDEASAWSARLSPKEETPGVTYVLPGQLLRVYNGTWIFDLEAAMAPVSPLVENANVCEQQHDAIRPSRDNTRILETNRNPIMTIWIRLVYVCAACCLLLAACLSLMS